MNTLATQHKLTPAGRRQRGYSLIELMVTIIIIGLLIGATLPAMNSVLVRGKNASLKSNARVVQSIVEGYRIDNNGEVPTGRSQMCASSTFTAIRNPYVQSAGALNTQFGSFGTSTCPTYDASASDTSAALLMYFTYSTALVNDSAHNGVIYYVPYKCQHDCNGTGTGCGVADGGSNCNIFPSLSGNTNTSGYEYYAIMGKGQDELSMHLYKGVVLITSS